MSSKPDALFRTSRRIEFADTDMAGLVHFANFFRFMEAAEVEFLGSRGLSVVMHWDCIPGSASPGQGLHPASQLYLSPIGCILDRVLLSPAIHH